MVRPEDGYVEEREREREVDETPMHVCMISFLCSMPLNHERILQWTWNGYVQDETARGEERKGGEK